MKVKVKTVWGTGFISIPTVYVDEAKAKQEGIEVECNGAEGFIPYSFLVNKQPRKDKFSDKFGRKKEYSLYDFFWNDFRKKTP